MCQCMSDKIPADKPRRRHLRHAEVQRLDAAGSGNLLDPSTLSQEQMQGLDAVVIAQASCM